MDMYVNKVEFAIEGKDFPELVVAFIKHYKKLLQDNNISNYKITKYKNLLADLYINDVKGIEEAFLDIGFQVMIDPDLKIVDFSFVNDYVPEEEHLDLFKQYLVNKSYIEYQEADGDIHRVYYINGKENYVYPKIIWPDVE